LLKVWANQDALFSELGNTFGADSDLRFRVGTGEFTDSLCLEPLTAYSADLIRFLGKYPNVVLELKSKFIDLSWMDAVSRPDRVLPAWSMNAPQVTANEELGASTLEERLQAAQTCVREGFRVCLHFDPIIYFSDWQEGYGRTIEMIFDYLSSDQIAYMSLGSFRHMPGLEKTIRRRHPQSRYIHNEFISGIDGKMRLLRPLRLEQFEFLVQRLRAHGMDRQLYYCMESDEVWRQTMGRTVADLGGLDNHLMRLAFGE
jgi:spore photoproduct lyase